MDFVKIINPVKGKTYNGRTYNVFVEIIYKDKNLSLHGVEGPLQSGNCLGGAGQIQDEFMLPNGKLKENYVLTEDWTEEMLMGLRVIWDAYHLNTLQEGCPHQEDAKYTYQNNKGHVCPICKYKIGSSWYTKSIPQDVIDWLIELPSSKLHPAWV